MKTTTLNLVCIIIFSMIVLSCKEKVKSEKGAIDIISNVYFEASKDLDKMQTFHIAKVNYYHDSIVEIVPNPSLPQITNEINFIYDSLYFNLPVQNTAKTVVSELVKKQKPKLVFNKKSGTIFSKEWIPNYRNRKKLSDTILFGKTYKRFEINSPWNYTRFYIYPTDTILPYSIYKHIEEDYNGRIERIDSYDKKKDLFVTLQLFPRKKMDQEAKDFFEFNQFINNNKTKK